MENPAIPAILQDILRYRKTLHETFGKDKGERLFCEIFGEICQ